MSTHNETETFAQALELAGALYQASGRELDEETRSWLAGESEITAADDERAFDLVCGAVYEGVFALVRTGGELAPETLWNRAQRKVQDEAARRDSRKRSVAPLHQRLLRLYWMVRLAAEELIPANPRTRLGKVLLTVERRLRDAFVETKEGIRLPPAMLRKTQWELLADYGMGLTVDEIYDLRSDHHVIEITGMRALALGFVLGAVAGFLLALVWIGVR